MRSLVIIRELLGLCGAGYLIPDLSFLKCLQFVQGLFLQTITLIILKSSVKLHPIRSISRTRCDLTKNSVKNLIRIRNHGSYLSLANTATFHLIS